MFKNKFYRNYLYLLFLSLGSIIGVGFISGAEIWTFFARFGQNSLFSVVILFVILTLFCYKTIINSNKYKCVNLQKNNNINIKNTLLIKSKIKEILLVFELVLFSATMLSGLKTLVYRLLNNNYLIVYIFIVFAVFICVYMGLKTISKFNFVVLLFILFLIGFMLKEIFSNIFFINENLFAIQEIGCQGLGESFLFAMFYLFLNIAHLMPIFDIHKQTLSKKQTLLFSISFSLIFCILILVFVLFLGLNSHLTALDMPFLYYFSDLGLFWNVFFIIILFGGLLSTLLVCLAGFKNKLEKHIKSRFSLTFLSIIIPLILSFFPFKLFINFIYPLIGVLNFVSLIFL